MEANRNEAELDGLHALVRDLANEDFLSPELSALEYAYSERLGARFLSEAE